MYLRLLCNLMMRLSLYLLARMKAMERAAGAAAELLCERLADPPLSFVPCTNTEIFQEYIGTSLARGTEFLPD